MFFIIKYLSISGVEPYKSIVSARIGGSWKEGTVVTGSNGILYGMSLVYLPLAYKKE